MKAMRVVSRIVQRQRFEAAITFSEQKKFSAAKSKLVKMLKTNKNSVAALVLLADIELFQNNLESSFAYYLDAERMVSANAMNLSDNDRIFLTAYIDFRKLAIRHMLESFDFSSWRKVAAQIRELAASSHLKRAFTLPE